jgi:hypothetical protein
MSPVTRDIMFKNVPSLLYLEYPDKDIRTSHRIVFITDDGLVPLYLRGIIYSGGSTSQHMSYTLIEASGTMMDRRVICVSRMGL